MNTLSSSSSSAVRFALSWAALIPEYSSMFALVLGASHEKHLTSIGSMNSSHLWHIAGLVHSVAPLSQLYQYRGGGGVRRVGRGR